MFDMAGIMKQAKAMQENMAKIQAELGQKTVEGSSGGGMVRVACSGRQEIRSIRIEKTVVDPEDLDMLQDLITAAVNDALANSRALMEEEMRAVTGGLNIPGLTAPGLNFPGM